MCQFHRAQANSDKGLAHGRVDGPVPENKLRDFLRAAGEATRRARTGGGGVGAAVAAGVPFSEAKRGVKRSFRPPSPAPDGRRPRRMSMRALRKECEPVFALLEESQDGLNEPCYKMFRVAAPFSLQTMKDQRHEAQEGLVKSLTNTFAKEETKKTEDADEAQARLLEKDAEQREAAADAKAKQDRVAEVSERLEAQSKAHTELEEALREAAKAVETAEERVRTFPEEVEATKAEREDYDKILNKIWHALKGNEWSDRRLWKKRQVMIQHMLAVFKELEVDESFLAAMEKLCRKDAWKGTDFGQKALQYGDDVIAGHIKRLEAKIRDVDGEAKWREQQVKAAKESVVVAEARVAASTGTTSTMEAELRAEEDIFNEAKAKADELGTQRAALDETRKAAKGKLQEFTELRKRFEALRDRSPAPSRAGGRRSGGRRSSGALASAASGAAAASGSAAGGSASGSAGA